MPPITLLTDFGRSDTYVAQMKGVILGIAPQAAIVDLTHEIVPGDIRSAALALDQTVDAFPPATIHVIVVDPGVGSERALVGVEAGRERFLAPDNGVLTDVLARHPPTRIHRLSAERYRRLPVSSTFHGRDLLAPAAAHWSLGADLADFGPRLSSDELVRLPACEPRCNGTGWLGMVVAADHFGNLITNLRSDLIPVEVRPASRVMIGETIVDGICRYYTERPAGTVLALFGSSGRLEIAVSGGNAAQQLGLGIGSPIHVTTGNLEQ